MRKLLSLKLIGGAALLALVAAIAQPSVAQAGPITLLTGDVTKLKFTDFDRILRAGVTVTTPMPGDNIEGVFFVTDIGSTTNSTLLNAQLAGTQLTGYFHLTVTAGPAPGTLGLTLAAGDQISFFTKSPNTFKDSTGSLAGDIAAATAGSLWAKSGPGDMPFGDIEGLFTITANILTNFSTNNTGYIIVPQPYLAPGVLTPADAGLFSHISPLSPAHPADAKALEAGWSFRSEDPVQLFALIPEPASVVTFSLGTGLLLLGLLYTRFRQCALAQK